MSSTLDFPGRPYQENINRPKVLFEKLLLDLDKNTRSIRISTQDGRDRFRQTEMQVAARELVNFNHQDHGNQTRGRRHATDGGVRLAGGMLGARVEDDIDQYSISDGSTLPPSYSSRIEES